MWARLYTELFSFYSLKVLKMGFVYHLYNDFKMLFVAQFNEIMLHNAYLFELFNGFGTYYEKMHHT